MQARGSLSYSFPKEETGGRRMEMFFFQFEFPQIAGSAEIALLLGNGDASPFRYQSLNRFSLMVRNAELRRLRS